MSAGEDRSTPSESRSFVARVATALDRFVPPSMPAMSDEAARARVGIAISFLMVPVFLVLGLAHLAGGRQGEALVNTGLAAATGLSPFALRATGRYLTVVNLTIGLALLGIGGVAIFDRGPGINAATVALAEIPLFATLITGVRVGTVWAIASCLVSAGIGVLGATGFSRPRPAPLFDDHVVLVMVTGTLFVVSVLYERGRAQSLRRIAELEARRHRTEIERMKIVSDARVAQAERLASLGRVVSAVAHEINNPLTYTLANLQFVASQLGPDQSADLRSAVDESLDGVRRIQRVAANLFPFRRGSADGAGDGADVAASIDAALDITSNHVRSNAQVTLDVGPLPRVAGDGPRVTQIFVNLLLNSAQAMKDRTAKENKVHVRAALRDDEVLVEIEDNGAGIPPDVIQSVTDPAFSAQPTGEGLALGIAVSHALAEAIGGKLEFESRPGRTVARVRLAVRVAPAFRTTRREAIEPPPAPREAPPAPAPVVDRASMDDVAPVVDRASVDDVAPVVDRASVDDVAPVVDRASVDDGRATVLIIDDEPFLVRALQRALRSHRVTAAPNGREALRLFDAGQSFDLILCDVMMPELSGMDVYATVQKTHPDLVERFVFMTGGTFTTRTKQFRESVTNVFIEKPVDMHLVRSLVEARTRSEPKKARALTEPREAR